jgi:hypothetical protein
MEKVEQTTQKSPLGSLIDPKEGVAARTEGPLWLVRFSSHVVVSSSGDLNEAEGRAALGIDDGSFQYSTIG